MNYENLLELVKNKRSIRRFRPDPLPEGIVEKVLEVARHVPSAANAQPWEFVVVEDPEIKKNISKFFVSLFREIAEKVDPTLYFECAVQPHMFTAPVLIVVCGDTRLQQSYPVVLDGKVLLHQSLALCVYAMQLAAASFGLATAWATIQEGPPETEVKKLLAIPDTYTVDHIIPLGYPDEEREKRDKKLRPVRERAPFRRELEEIVHYGHYDMGKLRSDEEVKQFIWSKSVVRIPRS